MPKVPLADDPLAGLQAPGRIGDVTLANRVVMTAMGSDLGDAGGVAGERIAEYYAARARGQVGLVITEAVAVAYPFGHVRPNVVALSEDRHIEGVARMAAAVHREGGRLCVQLNHGGQKAELDRAKGRLPWAPSSADADGGQAQFHVMTADDVAAVVDMFVGAAERAKQGGADAIEVHAAHGYLLSQFLSAHTNARQDEYGGSVENRARFVCEIIRSIRMRLGDGFPLICKLDAVEVGLDDGITLADAKRVARLVEEAGASAINASSYASAALGLRALVASHTPDVAGASLVRASEIRKVVKVPVLAGGRVTFAEAEAALQRGQVDFVTFGRRLLADAEAPRKMFAGRAQDIRPCIYTLGCVSEIAARRPLRCTVNTELGAEAYIRRARDASPRRAVVIGGGLAGLETARRLRAAGSEVTLYEREVECGGALRAAGQINPAFAELLAWLLHESTVAGVELRCGVDPTPDALLATGADCFVVATGKRRPCRSQVALSRLLDKATTNVAPENIAILGADVVGLELGLALARQGHSVALHHPGSSFGDGMSSVRIAVVMEALRELEVRVATGVRDWSFNVSYAEYLTSSGQVRHVECTDWIDLLATESDNSLAEILKESRSDTYVIGDAGGPGYISGAIMAAKSVLSALNLERL